MTLDLTTVLFEGIIAYLPVLMRVTSYLVTLPIWGQRVPAMVKIGLGALLTILIAPAVEPVDIPSSVGSYVFLIVEEVAIGLAMGLVVAMVVHAIYLAGQLIDVPLGFGMVNVLDPQTGIQIPIIAQLKFTLAMLVLFAVNGHHLLLSGLVQSFALVPVGFASPDLAVIARVGIDTFGALFVLALRIAIPIVTALFVTDVALGIVARAVPQINVFFVGIPLKIGLGMVLITFALPIFVFLISSTFSEEGEMMRVLNQLLHALRTP